MAGNVINACISNPEMTVAANFPIFSISARNKSPPPAAPNLEEINANTPKGAKYMTRCTIFIIAMFIPSKTEITSFPSSPSVVSTPPNTRENIIMGKISILAID